MLPQTVTPEQVESSTEVAGVQVQRGALARTGSGTAVAAAAGLGLVATGTALVRRSRHLA